MKIKTVCEVTGLTDRTIRYYIEEQLITPTYTENYLGRKSFNFSEEDVTLLKNISVLRKFDFTIEEIREIIRDAESSVTIIKSVKARNLDVLTEAQLRLSVLSRINDNRAYTVDELALELTSASEDLPKTEERTKKHFFKFILGALKTLLTFLIVWLPVATQILFFLVTLVIYSYPIYYPAAKIYIIVSVLPSLLVILLNRIKQCWRKAIRPILLILCIISFLCSIAFGYLPMGVVAKSETTDIRDYRKLDPGCMANRDNLFQELFPTWSHYYVTEKQPDGSWKEVYLDAHYYYRYIKSFDSTYDIYAQWPLSPEDYTEEVERATEVLKQASDSNIGDYSLAKLKKGDYNCVILYDTYAAGDMPFEQVTDNYEFYIFAYNDQTKTVRYICCSSLENGTDQPYYLTLDW